MVVEVAIPTSSSTDPQLILEKCFMSRGNPCVLGGQDESWQAGLGHPEIPEELLQWMLPLLQESH